MSEPGRRYPVSTPVNIPPIAENGNMVPDAHLFHPIPVHSSSQLAAAAAAVSSTTDPTLHDTRVHTLASTDGALANAPEPPKEGMPDAPPQKRTFDCKYCGWRFTLKGNLRAHVRRHTGEKPYKCSICSRKFTQSSLLTVHMRTHTGEKPFKCHSCGRTFSRSGNLHTHLRTHNDEKPYECAFCHKQFAQRVNMELHTRVHTGVKPYHCGVCDRAFTSCSNMRRHWRQIHPSYPEPALGTTHLQHGMPEKALYNVDVMRMPLGYRPEDGIVMPREPEQELAQTQLAQRQDMPEPLFPILGGMDAISSSLVTGFGMIPMRPDAKPEKPAGQLDPGKPAQNGAQTAHMHAMPPLVLPAADPGLRGRVDMRYTQPETVQMPMQLAPADDFDPAIKEEEALVTAAAVVQR